MFDRNSMLLGAAASAIGILVGLVSPFGIVIAFFGGVGSFTGVVLGALSLYLDFINMFQFLLSFMGNRE